MIPIWSEENKKVPMYSLFPTKSFCRYLIDKKISDSFWNLVVFKCVCFSAAIIFPYVTLCHMILTAISSTSCCIQSISLISRCFRFSPFCFPLYSLKLSAGPSFCQHMLQCYRLQNLPVISYFTRDDFHLCSSRTSSREQTKQNKLYANPC